MQSSNIVAIEIGDVCLVSVYMSPNAGVDVTCSSLENLLDQHRRVVLMGDLNCHLAGYTNRGLHLCDRRVQRMVNEFGLDVANSSTPTMDHNGTLSVNDYTLTRHCQIAN